MNFASGLTGVAVPLDDLHDLEVAALGGREAVGDRGGGRVVSNDIDGAITTHSPAAAGVALGDRVGAGEQVGEDLFAALRAELDALAEVGAGDVDRELRLGVDGVAVPLDDLHDLEVAALGGREAVGDRGGGRVVSNDIDGGHYHSQSSCRRGRAR
ncbi:MAG: hypothetical protein KatS3mg087_0857 [Patescibacteria group bacterium]|nr:MAG: hypothetical protein KatS3mg087_0857 [Patescibacteria group bacterium]